MSKANKTIMDYLGERSKPTFIGIAGVAGAGKDLFFSCIENQLKEQEVKVQRRAIADGLKEEISHFTTSAYAIDPRDCTREEKEQLRPLLVYHGGMRRKSSRGRYWIDLFESNYRVYQSELKREKEAEPNIVCITDIRYDVHENDEVTWLKDELDGVLVHLSQYRIEKDRKVFREPANEDEAQNEPRLKAKADYLLEWEYKSSKERLNPSCKHEAQKFIEWLSAHGTR